jgi:predicted nucleotidyltransferase
MSVLPLDSSKVADVCRRNEVRRLRVFGSYARGEATEASDMDLIADFSGPKSLLDIVRIEREMSSALGVRVDLLTEGAISPYIRERIADDLRVIYEAG